MACSSSTDSPKDFEEHHTAPSGGTSTTAGTGGNQDSTVGTGGAGNLGSGGQTTSTGGDTLFDQNTSYFDFSSGDERGLMTDDFSPLHFKGQCSSGEAMTGLSFEASCGAPRTLQCEAHQVVSMPTASVSPFCGDARRDDSTGDWDNGYRKGECGTSEAVVGVARDRDGAMHDVLCAEMEVGSAGACTVRNVNGGDNRGRTATGDWDPGSIKAECEEGEYVKGISLDPTSRRVHAILCCSGSGDLNVASALNEESVPDDKLCRPNGADATITAFDKAHMTGGSRYVYKTVDFPDAGSYENITMSFSLGCPAAGCDPWDRWGNIGIVLKKDASNSDRDELLELGRFVTPYGVGGTFTYDLTSLRPALRGKIELRIFIDTWVDGWLATARFEMKGGKPAREPRFVLPLWTAPHVGVGVPSRAIADTVPPREIKVPETVCDVGVRAIITGHGQGNKDNCAEFCPKITTLRSAEDPMNVEFGATIARLQLFPINSALGNTRAPAGARARTCEPWTLA